MRNKLLSMPVLMVLLILFATTASAAIEWKITPSEPSPTIGKTLKLKGTASPGENVKTEVSFVKELPVSAGSYRYLIENVKIPQLNNGAISVRVEGVKSLNLGLKDGAWVTYSPKVSNGVAVVSKENIAPSTYSLLVSGDAQKGKSSVNLKITISQTLKADSKGNFEFNYDTSSLPAGTYIIKIGSTAKTIELKAKK